MLPLELEDGNRCNAMDEPLNERRLASRVYGHWAEMALAKRFARMEDIDPWLLAADWSRCVLIRLDRDPGLSTFVMVGENLLPQHNESLVGRPITACPRDTLLGAILKYLPRFRPTGGPIGISGPATHLGAPVLFRGVLLPLSTDGNCIDHVLGAANFRPMLRGEEKQLRARLQVSMLRVEKGQIWNVYAPLSGGWVQAKVTAVEGDHASLRQSGAMQTISCKTSDMTQHPERYRFISYVDATSIASP
jgi:hypothetical protein